MYKILTYLMVGTSCVFLYACQGTNKSSNLNNNELKENKIKLDNSIKKSSLKDYLKTNDVKIDQQGKLLTIAVANSKLVHEKRIIMGKKWTNSEAIISVAAINLVDSLPPNIDSLNFKISMDYGTENYTYSTRQLFNVNKYLNTAQGFLNALLMANLKLQYHYYPTKLNVHPLKRK